MEAQMTQDEREFLSELCAELQRRFPGVIAAFEDFVSGELGGPRDGYLVVEILNVPDDKLERLSAARGELTFDYFDHGGRPVIFGLWTCEETEAHFIDDVTCIMQARAQLLQHAPGLAWRDGPRAEVAADTKLTEAA